MDGGLFRFLKSESILRKIVVIISSLLNTTPLLYWRPNVIQSIISLFLGIRQMKHHKGVSDWWLMACTMGV